jgi:hypothetical protein
VLYQEDPKEGCLKAFGYAVLVAKPVFFEKIQKTNSMFALNAIIIFTSPLRIE